MTIDSYIDCALAGWQLLILVMVVSLGLFAWAGWRRASKGRTCATCCHWWTAPTPYDPDPDRGECRAPGTQPRPRGAGDWCEDWRRE